MQNGRDEQTRIILVRHGECQGNLENRFRGRKDYPLNERGRKQAIELAAELESINPDAIYSSPLKRAMETAAPLARKLSMDVIGEEGINNIYLGKWEGRLKSEIAREFPEQWETWINTPEKLLLEDSEPFPSVQKRSLDSLARITEKHRGQTVVVVSHRTTLKPLVAGALSIPEPYFWKIHFDTASYSVLIHEKQRGFCLYRLNETKHLSELNVEWI